MKMLLFVAGCLCLSSIIQAQQETIYFHFPTVAGNPGDTIPFSTYLYNGISTQYNFKLVDDNSRILSAKYVS